MNRLGSFAFLLMLAAGCGHSGGPSSAKDVLENATHYPADSLWRVQGRIDPTRLPILTDVGNRRLVTSGPEAGYVYACDPNMFSFANIIGARTAGPWIDLVGKTFDMTQKVAVSGAVTWDGAFSVTVAGASRVFRGNGLPVGATTGVFPIATTDPASQFDGNPNSVEVQDISFSLPAQPTLGDRPSCIGKHVGITLDGIQIDGPLDSSGRDETAYQLSDLCGGRAQPGGLYHRNTISDCAPHMKEPAAQVGYALDGFGIYSMFDAGGTEITSADLDDCHGTTSMVTFDGVEQEMYHYVLTRDWPYSITCFRGTPNYDAFPPLPPMSSP